MQLLLYNVIYRNMSTKQCYVYVDTMNSLWQHNVAIINSLCRLKNITMSTWQCLVDILSGTHIVICTHLFDI